MAIRESLIALGFATGIAYGQGSVQEIPQHSSPVPTHKVEPDNTDAARNSRIEGAVLLQVEVDEKGFPTEAKVIRSLDPGLDRKATEAVLKWRFKPALKVGKPVPSSARIEITFRILR